MSMSNVRFKLAKSALVIMVNVSETMHKLLHDCSNKLYLFQNLIIFLSFLFFFSGIDIKNAGNVL